MKLNTREKENKTLKITLIIPTFNEESNLPHVLPQIPDIVDEIIIVDGHSLDNTVATAGKLCPRAHIIYQEGKGKGNALRTGFKYANGDIVVTMDADGLKAAGSSVGTAGLIVMDEDTDLIRVIRRITEFYHHESCGQCTPCREGTGWMAKILRRFEVGEGTMADLDLLLDVANNIEGNTICALGDAAAWPVHSMVKRFRDEFEKRCRPSSIPSSAVAAVS